MIFFLEKFVLLLLLEAAADAGAGLGGGLGGGAAAGGVEVVELGLVEGDLGVLGVVVNLHRLDVGRGDLAQGALQLGVPALLDPRTVQEPRLAAAPVGCCCVHLRLDFLGRVLLWLRLPCHRRLREGDVRECGLEEREREGGSGGGWGGGGI